MKSRSRLCGDLLRSIMPQSLALLLVASACAQDKPADLSKLSMEDLMNIEVTSASKKEQKLSEVAAAIFVISREDIRQSGARNIPDLLRMVPGLDVAQINANIWAISARGFNAQVAGKLLVLIDGRSVYTPVYGGVYWDTQDLPIDDIERIEVIRGPGATVWGANAVNGVINIITRKTADTPGTMLSGGDGNVDQGFGTIQHGGQLGEKTSYRAYVKYFNYAASPALAGGSGHDDWHLLHGGFRADSDYSKRDAITVQGDLYSGTEGDTIAPFISLTAAPTGPALLRVGLSGGDVLGRWRHVFSSPSDATLQVYFDRYKRDGPFIDESRNTFDIDFRHHAALGARHDPIWGAGYRRSSDKTEGIGNLYLTTPDLATQLFNVFAQDEMTLRPNLLYLTAGAKVEHDYYTGFDVAPSVRLRWMPSGSATFWTSISRASLIPARYDTALVYEYEVLPGPGGIPILATVFGNPRLKSEHVIAYELGYRAQASRAISVDLAGVFNAYSHLQDRAFSPPYLTAEPPPLHIEAPLTLNNKQHGTTEGLEVAANWKASGRWTLSPGYSFLEIHLHDDGPSAGVGIAATLEGMSPRHQAQLRSQLSLIRGFSWDLDSYFVHRLPAEAIPSYTRVDTQLRWSAGERLEISAVGQNLLQTEHIEMNGNILELQTVHSTEVKRSIFGKITWHF